MPSCIEKPLSPEDISHVEKNCIDNHDQFPCCSPPSGVSFCTEEQRDDSQSATSTLLPDKRHSSSFPSTTNPQGFQLLPGEEIEPDDVVDMGNCRIYLSQYRIVILGSNQNAACSVSLIGVESLEAKDITGLHITCRDGRVVKLRADNSETAIAWYKKLTHRTCVARDIDNIFAFRFCSFINENPSKMPRWIRVEPIRDPLHNPSDIAFDSLHREFKQLRLNENYWRITNVNKKFELCSTYPQYLIMPASVTDDELKVMRFGRFHCRIPTLVWKNRQNGAVLLRSSQPNLAFFGMMTNENDVKLYEKLRTASLPTVTNPKFLIVDARSYTSAWANRAKSGGFESSDTYQNAEVVFMGLPNIHSIRYSFHQLRQLLNSNPESSTYLQILQSTLWLQNIGQLFSAVERCLNALCKEGIPVLVHCSDGWDRTTQIISLCMLIADPNYRTFEGFRTLVQRQWIDFGHKFADRNSVLNGDENEKSPVFLQWLDCVYQLWEKNPDAFQFNRRYLMKLVQHAYSGLFGSFLFNCVKDAIEAGCISLPILYDSNFLTNGLYQKSPNRRAFSIWDYLGKHTEEFHNPAYNSRQSQKHRLIYPKYLPELVLWRDAYCNFSSMSFINDPDECNAASSGVHDDKQTTTLSRSQSASSLTSLEQTFPAHSHCFNNSGSQVGLNHAGQISAGNSASCTNGFFSSFSNSSFNRTLDVDGLTQPAIMFEDRMLERIRELNLNYLELQRTKHSPIITSASQQGSHSHHRELNGLSKLPVPVNNAADTPKHPTKSRTRNESVDSTGFEHLTFDCRQKHNSSSTNASANSVLPSSFSSTCTPLNEYNPSSLSESLTNSTSTMANETHDENNSPEC